MTSSPRPIGIEFGYCFGPEECIRLAVGVQLGNLCRNPVAHGFGARIRHNHAQFAQALPSAPRAHHLHSFGGFGHFLLRRSVTRTLVTRYEPGSNSAASSGAMVNREIA